MDGALKVDDFQHPKRYLTEDKTKETKDKGDFDCFQTRHKSFIARSTDYNLHHLSQIHCLVMSYA